MNLKMIYIYDGSFEGLCSAVFTAYNDTGAMIYSRFHDIPPLLERTIVRTDEKKSERLQNGIQNKLSRFILRDLYLIYLSDMPSGGTAALKYLRFCFKNGKGSRALRYIPEVKEALLLRDKVMTEVDKLRGLIRFDKAREGLYIARIEPDHNILPLIAHHFANRMRSHSFVIHDIRRGLAICSKNGSYVITELPEDFEFAINDDDFREMWKEYFDTMAIKERINPKLQRQHMPRRYWSHLTEMKKD